MEPTPCENCGGELDDDGYCEFCSESDGADSDDDDGDPDGGDGDA